MTITTLQTLINTVNAPEIVEELKAELAKAQKVAEKNAQKATERNAVYDAAFKAVEQTLSMAGVPLTASEIWEGVQDEMPEGFTFGQLVYGLSHLWAVNKGEGKVRTYTL